MLFHEVRVWTYAGLLSALLGVIGGSAAAAAVEISTPRVASSFLYGETVQFSITSDLPVQQLAWSVTDYYGDVRAEGVIQAGEGSTNLRVAPGPGIGYHTLSLRYESGAQHQKAFCVLPHPDDARGDGGLFGIGGVETADWYWDALWQMGARHCRAEFAWTEVERVQGRYDLQWVRAVSDLARERDMQLTVLTGHTPRHYSVKPIDAEGRVDSAYYTWQPADTIEWYEFIDAMARTLVPQRLAAEPARRTDTIARRGKSLVRAWEVWSEADQNFYYGSWNRYLDMLRIAYSTVRREGRVPVVYGSCGHMTEMKRTINAGCDSYFDRIAYHPYSDDPRWMMMHWYRNMPQALAEVGMLRDTALTECGFHPKNGATEEGFMPRVYATLKTFDEDLFIRAQCLGGVFPGHDRRNALAVRSDGELIPKPAYVAFAVTRWLLESAQYVGPLDAPEGTTLELFIRQGSPVVVGWTDEGTRQVELDVSPMARVMDALGKSAPVEGPRATVELSPNAVAVLGVSFEEFRRAASAGLDLILSSELGHESPHNSRWMATLEEDLASCTGPGSAEDLRDALEGACDRLMDLAPHGATEFFELQRMVGDLMLEVAQDARERKSLLPVHTNTIWRLARLAERLGGIADGLGARWPRMNNVSPSDMQNVIEDISRTRARVERTTGGAQCPFADRLFDRALSSLDEVRRVGGHARGAWWAAVVNSRVAHSLTAIEEPVMRRVFVTGNFASGDIITKGVLLRPTPDHTLEARVYNFLPEGVSGRVNAMMPEDWGGKAPGGSFTAPAGGASEPIELSYAVPHTPTPWVQRPLGRIGWKDITVDAPPTANLHQMLNIRGEMSRGELLPMTYRVYVGAYPPSETEPAGAESHSADDLLRLSSIMRPAGEPATVPAK